MFEIHALPIYRDNYVWIITVGDNAWVIDPGDHQPVVHFLQQRQLHLRAVLITHRHWDHVTGVQALVDAQAPKEVPVYGPYSEPINHLITRHVSEGDTIAIGPLQAEVWQTPGHTLDHIGYYIAAQNLLFCGDTLFACGCGKLFDGTMEQLFNSLQRIAALPPATQIYCTHEYTLANMRFALAADPHNPHLQQRYSNSLQTRQHHKPTLPTRLDLELLSNPFLRCHTREVQETVRKATNVSINDAFSCFAALRHWKNRY